jgi:hypothetical protein
VRDPARLLASVYGAWGTEPRRRKASLVRRLTLLSTVGAVALAGCGGSSPTTTTMIAPKVAHRPTTFHLTISASLVGGQIRVSGTTNLPDGSRVTIGAWRAFKQTHYAVRVSNFGRELADEDTAVVLRGRFNGAVPAVEKILPTVAIPGDPGGPIAKVDSDATVCAQFMTGRDLVSNGPWAQPDPAVRAEVGSFGKYLHGSPHVQVFGSLTKYPSLYIDAVRRLPVPRWLRRGGDRPEAVHDARREPAARILRVLKPARCRMQTAVGWAGDCDSSIAVHTRSRAARRRL